MRILLATFAALVVLAAPAGAQQETRITIPAYGTDVYGDAFWFDRPMWAGDDATALLVGSYPDWDTAPPDVTSKDFARFTFSSRTLFDYEDPTFQCRIDDGEWTACGEPDENHDRHVEYAELAEGPHTFAVRSVDREGTADPTPAEFSWRVDTVPPDTSVAPAPLPLAGLGQWGFNPRSTEVNYDFYAIDVDWTAIGLGDGWTYCSPCGIDVNYGGVGHHRWGLAAIDPAGNVDPTPAYFEFDLEPYPESEPLKPPTPEILASVRDAGRGYARVKVRSSLAGSLRVRLTDKRVRSVGLRKLQMRRAGTKTFKVRLGRKPRAQLRKRGRMNVRAVVSLKGPEGSRLTASAKGVLRR